MNQTLQTLPEEQLVLISCLRRIGVGEMWCPLIRYELLRVYGAAGDEVHAALRDFIICLARYGRRRWRLGLPGLPVLTADELSFLAMIEAAADEDRLSAHLAWLLARADITPALDPARRVGQCGGQCSRQCGGQRLQRRTDGGSSVPRHKPLMSAISPPGLTSPAT